MVSLKVWVDIIIIYLKLLFPISNQYSCTKIARLALSDNFTKYRTKTLCLYKTSTSIVYKNVPLVMQK